MDLNEAGLSGDCRDRRWLDVHTEEIRIMGAICLYVTVAENQTNRDLFFSESR